MKGDHVIPKISDIFTLCLLVFTALMFLLMWLLHPEPTKRAKITDLQKDKWTHQPINIEDYKWSEVLPHNPEFNGNTAADNRIDSPATKAAQEGLSRYSGRS